MSPNPAHLFSLVPLNPAAINVLTHDSNKYLVVTLNDNVKALGIGLNTCSDSPKTLATMGRGKIAAVFIPGSRIARIQCSFEINLETGIVMFFDRSNSCTSQVSGKNATPFMLGRPRMVVVHPNANNIIEIGGTRQNMIRFELKWHQKPEELKRDVLRYFPPGDPRLDLTVVDASTELPTRQTRVHTAAAPSEKVRYVYLGDLGSGTFGVVRKVANADTGKLMAVKVLKRPESRLDWDKWNSFLQHSFKREVEALAQIAHPNVVDYITSQNWNTPHAEIFMGLKDGNLDGLIRSGAESGTSIADEALYHMLKALDCLACVRIIHRDVKPENILYTKDSTGKYIFQLGDFGLSNRTVGAETKAGTELFMAPEVYDSTEQTFKVDIWSLFVTMMWVLNVQKFRQVQFRNHQEVRKAVAAASKVGPMPAISGMAVLDPLQRASAAQMLVKLYHGNGLTTPRRFVPALVAQPPL